MSDDARLTSGDSQWTFECQVCGHTRNVDHESEALGVCGDHDDHTGHFNFEITDPDGEVRYP